MADPLVLLGYFTQVATLLRDRNIFCCRCECTGLWSDVIQIQSTCYYQVEMTVNCKFPNMSTSSDRLYLMVKSDECVRWQCASLWAVKDYIYVMLTAVLSYYQLKLLESCLQENNWYYWWFYTKHIYIWQFYSTFFLFDPQGEMKLKNLKPTDIHKAQQ